MTDPIINGVSRNLQSNRPGGTQVRKSEAGDASKASGLAVPGTPGSVAKPADKGVHAQDDIVDLSDLARSAMSDTSFDRTKVEAIKQALKDGKYPLDSRRIAESFVALERMIGQ